MCAGAWVLRDFTCEDPTLCAGVWLLSDFKLWDSIFLRRPMISGLLASRVRFLDSGSLLKTYRKLIFYTTFDDSRPGCLQGWFS